MEILTSYEFKRPSTSRYAPVVNALVTDGAKAVRIKRGEDFPAEISMDSVQGAVSQEIRKAGARARTFRESDDVLVIALRGEGEAPRRKRATKQPALAAA